MQKNGWRTLEYYVETCYEFCFPSPPSHPQTWPRPSPFQCLCVIALRVEWLTHDVYGHLPVGWGYLFATTVFFFYLLVFFRIFAEIRQTQMASVSIWQRRITIQKRERDKGIAKLAEKNSSFLVCWQAKPETVKEETREKQRNLLEEKVLSLTVVGDDSRFLNNCLCRLLTQNPTVRNDTQPVPVQGLTNQKKEIIK